MIIVIVSLFFIGLPGNFFAPFLGGDYFMTSGVSPPVEVAPATNLGIAEMHAGQIVFSSVS
jgi:hypothetical protein